MSKIKEIRFKKEVHLYTSQTTVNAGSCSDFQAVCYTFPTSFFAFKLDSHTVVFARVAPLQTTAQVRRITFHDVDASVPFGRTHARPTKSWLVCSPGCAACYKVPRCDLWSSTSHQSRGEASLSAPLLPRRVVRGDDVMMRTNAVNK